MKLSHVLHFAGMASRTTRVLLLMVIPGHLIFMYTIHYMQAGHTSITLIFAVAYLTAAFIQVCFREDYFSFSKVMELD